MTHPQTLYQTHTHNLFAGIKFIEYILHNNLNNGRLPVRPIQAARL